MEGGTINSGGIYGKSRWIRAAKWIGGGIVVLILLVCLLFTTIVRLILRHEIQIQVSGLLNGELEIDSIAYHPFLSVSISRARLMVTGPDGNRRAVAEIGGLDVDLAQLPFHGPIVIDQLTLTDPSIHLIRLHTGEVVFQPNLMRPQPPSPAGPAVKISEVIQVRHFKLKNLTLDVTDQTSANHVTLARLDASADLTSGNSGYSLHAALADEPLAKGSLEGSLDVDRNVLSLRNVSVTGHIADDRTLGELPAAIQQFCRRDGLVGVGAKLEVADGLTLSIDPNSNRWRLSGLSGNLTVSGSESKQTASGRVSFQAVAGGPMPSSDEGVDYLRKLDPDTLVSVAVDPKTTITITSPGMPEPITQGAGTVRFSKGVFAVDGLRGEYGKQALSLDATLRILNDRLSLDTLHAGFASGTVQITDGRLTFATPRQMTADVQFAGIDLKQVRELLLLDDPKGRFSGVAFGNVKISGAVTQLSPFPLDKITADGKMHAENGNFFRLPVISDVAAKVDMKSLAEVGRAGAVFTVSSGTIHFSKLAVSCPLVGIQGSGHVGLLAPNALDLHLVVAPLGDWRAMADKTGIAGLGKFVGQVQAAISKVSQKVLYNFHVTGPAAKPSIQAEAAPMLTKEAGKLFTQMTQPGQGNLLDSLQSGGNEPQANTSK